MHCPSIVERNGLSDNNVIKAGVKWSRPALRAHTQGYGFPSLGPIRKGDISMVRFHPLIVRTVLVFVSICLLCVPAAPRVTMAQSAETDLDLPHELPNVASLSPDEYLKTVSWAKEAMRLIQSPMDEQQERQFDAEWAPAFRHPCVHLVSYLNTLLPLLQEYVSLRTQMMAAAEGFDAAWLEANLMTKLEDPAGVLEALSVAWDFKQQLLGLQKPMEEVVEKIGELGPPPDPEACRRRRRKLHDDSVNAMNETERAPGAAWVLVKKELITPEDPFVGTQVEKGALPVTNTWRWRYANKGNSMDCELAYVWTHIVEAGSNKTKVVHGEAINALHVVWARLPEIVPFAVNKKGAKVNVVTVPMKATDKRRESKQPIRSGETSPMYADSPHERHVGAGLTAQLHAPGGEELYRNAVWGLDDNTGLGDAKCNIRTLQRAASWQAAANIPFRFNAEQWPEHYERINGKKLALPAGARPGEGWTMDVRVYVWNELWGDIYLDEEMEQKGSYGARRNLGVIGMRYVYEYDLDAGIEPISLAGEPNMWEGPTNAGPPSKDDLKRLEELAKSKEAKIEFHKAAIEICKSNIQRWRDEMSRIDQQMHEWRMAKIKRAQTPGAKPAGRASKNRITDLVKQKERLAMSMLNAQHTLMAEQDRIKEVATGEIVHTRTPVDEWYHKRFVDRVTKRMEPSVKAARYKEGTRRMIRLAPKDQQEDLQAFVARQHDGITTWGDDSGKAQKIARVVFDKVQGHWEGVHAKSIDEALAAEECLQRAQIIKTVADVEMFVATMGASGSWTAANLAMPCYMGGTEFLQTEGTTEHRLYQAVKTGLAWSNAAGQVVSDAMTGYEKGGWLNGEKGWWGALEKGSQSLLLTAGTHYAISKFFKQAPGLAKPTVEDAFEYARHKQRMEEAQVMIKDYDEAYREYQRVLEFGGRADEVVAMEKMLKQKAAGLHSSYEAKLMLKKMQDPTNPLGVVADFNQRMAEVHREVEERFRQIMVQRGYADVASWHMKEFRNAASAGTVGMDYDIGLMPRELMAHPTEVIDLDIPLLDKQVRLLDKADDAKMISVEIPFMKNGVRVPPHKLQKEAQFVWNHAYSGTTGYGAGRSFESLTTYVHPEIYTDLAWLGGKGVKGVNIGELVAAKAGQAGDVTMFKVMHMGHDPAWAKMQSTIEASRGMAKDIRTKLLPLLEEAANQTPGSAQRFKSYQYHWKQLGEAMAGAADDPRKANEQIRLIPGGKGIEDIALDLRDMIAGYGQKLGK